MDNKIILRESDIEIKGSYESAKVASLSDELLIKASFAGGFSELTVSLISYDSMGEATELYKQIVPKTEGEYEFEHSFDPISAAVYQGASSFSLLIKSESAFVSKLTIEEIEIVSSACDNDDDIDNTGIGENGEKIVYITDMNGKRIAIPRIPSKVLFIGNSLLIGMGAYGMCASAPDKDYYHYVTSHIREYNPDCKFEKLYGSQFEHAENMETVDKWYYKSVCLDDRDLAAASKLTPDLDIVFIQLGDNVNTDAKVEMLKTSCALLIERIKKACPRARIIWIHGWYKKAVSDPHIEKTCDSLGIERININSCRSKDGEAHHQKYYYNVAEGKVLPVKENWVTHPGDIGMKRIADKIIKKLKLEK